MTVIFQLSKIDSSRRYILDSHTDRAFPSFLARLNKKQKGHIKVFD